MNSIFTLIGLTIKNYKSFLGFSYQEIEAEHHSPRIIIMKSSLTTYGNQVDDKLACGRLGDGFRSFHSSFVFVHSLPPRPPLPLWMKKKISNKKNLYISFAHNWRGSTGLPSLYLFLYCYLLIYVPVVGAEKEFLFWKFIWKGFELVPGWLIALLKNNDI